MFDENRVKPGFAASGRCDCAAAMACSLSADLPQFLPQALVGKCYCAMAVPLFAVISDGYSLEMFTDNPYSTNCLDFHLEQMI